MQKYLHYWVNLHGWGMFYSIFFYSLFYRPVGAHPVYEATWAETELRSSAAAALYTWSSVAGLAGADTAKLGVRSVQNCQAAAH